MIEILKCIFIPFYGYKKYNNDDGYAAAFFLYGMCLAFYIFVRLTYGLADANKPDKCKAKSIGDVIIAPMYTLGCNIGKDRFDIKLN